MKKLLKIVPAFIIVAAAVLCLSFDNNGKLTFTNTDEQSELFQTTIPVPKGYKVVSDGCPDGVSFNRECLSGGLLQCTPITCPPPPAP